MVIEKIVLFFCVLIAGWTRLALSEKIELVQILLRHGERTPVPLELNLMNLMNAEVFEPYGLGQLTNKGKADMFSLGQMLRTRYSHFLGPIYKPSDVYARSSDYDRSIIALQLVLAGLFPPTDRLTWNNNLNWLPVPIHTTPRPIDNLFLLLTCPRYKQMLEDILKSQDIINQVSQYTNLINKLNKINPNVQYDLAKVMRLKNLLQAYIIFNVRMPSWIKDLYAEINNLSKLYLDILSYTTEMIRLNGGAFVKRFVENMNANGNQNRSKPKIYIYSGHEFNLYAVLKAHKVTLPLPPALGSAIILEKVRDDNDQLYVRMIYFTGDTRDIIPVVLSCSDKCTIHQYLNLVNEHLPTNEDMQCLIKNIKLGDQLEF